MALDAQSRFSLPKEIYMPYALSCTTTKRKINKGKTGSHTAVSPLGDRECGEDTGVRAV